ncbi:hypothetical protein ABZX95_45530 [Streptomyces sp. NPDC004232]|uniref:hypothetical protein n=1 Tax=Streptomyces sp. NPDC004232 TaxID=3154454 RepID=UPI0033A53C8A
MSSNVPTSKPSWRNGARTAAHIVGWRPGDALQTKTVKATGALTMGSHGVDRRAPQRSVSESRMSCAEPRATTSASDTAIAA